MSPYRCCGRPFDSERALLLGGNGEKAPPPDPTPAPPEPAPTEEAPTPTEPQPAPEEAGVPAA